MEAAVEVDRGGEILAEIASKGDFPAAAQAIERLQRVARKEDCTALSLAHVILQDAGLSSKVLRIVNSAFYRSRGVPVSTITRAVILLGFDRICELATGLLLIEQFVQHGRNNVVLRENLRRSLRCGIVAQALSEKISCGVPEEAYLLGMFSNLGVLWLATHYPAHLGRAVELEKSGAAGSLEQGIVKATGVSSAQIAAQLLEQWSLPSNYTGHFLRQAARESDAPRLSSDRWSALVELADAYARQAERSPEPATALLSQIEKALSLSPEQSLALFERAEGEMREQVKILGLEPPPPPPSAATSVAARSGAPGRGSGLASPGEPQRAADGSAAAEVAESANALALGIVTEITHAILMRDDINHVLGVVLEGIARSGRYDAVVLALITVQRDRLVGRLAYGEGVQQQLSKISAPLAPGSGLLAEAVIERRPRIVATGLAASLLPPGAPVPSIPCASFLIEPLVVRDRAVGVILATRRVAGSVSSSDLALLQTFSNLAGIALAEIGGRSAPG
jgi:HD-like signal output (HDOD) protein